MKRRTLALILAAALTVTSVEGTAVMASAAEFTSGLWKKQRQNWRLRRKIVLM